MGKMKSERAVEALETKVNDNRGFPFTICPRCGEQMDYGDEVFDGQEHHAFRICKPCGIMVDLIYEFHSVEIKLYEETPERGY